MELVLDSLRGANRHKDSHHGWDSFKAAKLMEGLGRDYKKYLEPLYSFELDNEGYSAVAGKTKMYSLHPSVRNRARKVLRSYDGHGRIVNEHGRPLFTQKWPIEGNECTTSGITVPALLPVSLYSLNETIESLIEIEKNKKKAGTVPDDITTTIDQLCYIRRWVVTSGGIPNFYKEQSTGRLGSLGELHVIGLSNTVRKLLFRGTGWYDFDFRNCHYSLFRCLCSYHGFLTPFADEWTADRDRITDLFWSTREIPPANTKQTMLSLLNGGPLAPYSQSQTTQLMGYEVMKLLSEEPWFFMFGFGSFERLIPFHIQLRYDFEHSKKQITEV